jgi:hypothetical protein
MCGDQRDLFIWPFPFRAANLGPAANFRDASVGFDRYLARAELPQKF